MSSHLYGKTIPFAAAVVFALTCGIHAADAITPASEALKRSQGIDAALQQTARDFNRELEQTGNQFHESQRLGTSTSVTNRYGNIADIDKEIRNTVDIANDELKQAWNRDEYTEKRRELQTAQSLYTPGSEPYQRYARELDRLDSDFAATGRK